MYFEVCFMIYVCCDGVYLSYENVLRVCM